MYRATSLLTPLAALALTSSALALPQEGVPREVYDDPTVGAVAPTLFGTDDAIEAPRGEPFFSPAPVDLGPEREPARPSFRQAEAPSQWENLLYATDESGSWVRGKSYKAHVSPEGFTYFPDLGSAAPRNFPVGFRLDSVSLGGAQMRLSGQGQVSQRGDRFVLDRGPVDVIYDMDSWSVEQSFALDVAGAAGDLVLELLVTTELVGQVADAGGFEFVGEFGGVGYGSAVVLDGAGRRAPVAATLEGGRIRLTVPASFLAEAEGRVIVDPLVGTINVANYDEDQEFPDVTYNRSTDSYLFVYEDSFSGSDGDVYMRRFDSGGNYLDQGFVDFSADDWSRPSVANVDRFDASLIVAQRVTAGTGEAEIVGRVFVEGTATLGGLILIGPSGFSWDNFRPDVGGTWANEDTAEFIVVWERRFTDGTQLPRYRMVNPNGTLGPINFVVPGGNVIANEVSVSESAGDPGNVNVWNVAYRSEDLTTDRDSVVSFQVNAAGAVVTGPDTLTMGPVGERLREIEVSEGLALRGLDPSYLVSYDNFSTVGDPKPILVCRNSSSFALQSLTGMENTTQNRDYAALQFGTTREEFIATYLEGIGGTYDVYLSTLDLVTPNLLGVSERRLFLGTAGDGIRGKAAIASRQSGGLTSRWSGIGWSALSGAGHWNIRGARHSATSRFAAGTQFCVGTPNSTGDRGFISVYGDDQLTSTKTLEASALPLNAFGYFINGTGATTIPNAGGSSGNICIAGGMLGRYTNLVASTGTTGMLSINVDPLDLPTSTGPVSAFAGQRWNFQLWHRDTDGSGGLTSNFTNAVSILFL